MNNLNNMINNGNIPDNIMNILNNFKSENSNFSNANNANSSDNSSSNIDINTILKMKSIMEKMNETKNDPRSNLLLSLKPYLKESRKNKVEQYIQIFNMTHLIEALNNDNGGEKTK